MFEVADLSNSSRKLRTSVSDLIGLLTKSSEALNMKDLRTMLDKAEAMQQEGRQIYEVSYELHDDYTAWQADVFLEETKDLAGKLSELAEGETNIAMPSDEANDKSDDKEEGDVSLQSPSKTVASSITQNHWNIEEKEKITPPGQGQASKTE